MQAGGEEVRKGQKREKIKVKAAIYMTGPEHGTASSADVVCDRVGEIGKDEIQ